MATGKRVMVKLLIDKEESQVVLAESSKDFVDILFSFLTMPLGTVIRILGNRSSSLCCFVNIYQSVENLASDNLCTEACKTMLLRPRNSAEVECADLAVNIDDTDIRTFFACKDCIANFKCFYSSTPDSRCICGQLMSRSMKWPRDDEKAQGDGVFVNGELRFFITDDLNVVTASAAILMRTFKIMEIEDVGKLEERNLELDGDEIASLLWRALISTSPLTDLCFNKLDEEVPARGQTKKDVIQPKQESEPSDVDCNSKEIKLKLILNKESNKIVFAEADSDMVDLLFSWLTFPLGLLAKHAKGMPHGCIDNLSKCAECNGIMKSEECKSMLLSPKLAPFHGCSNQMLDADEMVPITRNYLAVCKQVNPRSPNNGTEVGGGYARAFRKYIVTDDLRVFPLSLRSYVQILSEFGIPASSLVEREVSLGVTQASDLLRAALVSSTALTDVFPPAKKHRRLPCSDV